MLNNADSKRIAQFRTSSHMYKVESGRHGINRVSPANRACPNCSSEDHETLELLFALPGTEPIIEDELHILLHCPHYNDLRQLLHPKTKALLSTNPEDLFNNSTTLRDIGSFIRKVHDRRFPKDT